MTPKEREKQIYQRLRADHGDEIRGLRTLAQVLGVGYSTASRQLSAGIINIPTFKRGRDVSAYTDQVAKYLSTS